MIHVVASKNKKEAFKYTDRKGNTKTFCFGDEVTILSVNGEVWDGYIHCVREAVGEESGIITLRAIDNGNQLHEIESKDIIHVTSSHVSDAFVYIGALVVMFIIMFLATLFGMAVYDTLSHIIH